jgi:NADP-dependent 3-hydroxy acid dehydrogenase YdfG
MAGGLTDAVQIEKAVQVLKSRWEGSCLVNNAGSSMRKTLYESSWMNWKTLRVVLRVFML